MDKDKKNKNESQIQIELPEEVAGGHYANLVMIAHSPSEFLLDFIQIVPGTPKARVKSRIILTPDHAVRMLQALQENIGKYEKSFGKIEERGAKYPSIPMNFGGNMGEA